MKLDSLSVIIVCREADQAKESIEAIKTLLKIDPCSIANELLIAEGNAPSEQRNEAAARAQGAWLLFLDNDSVVDPMILEYYRLALAEFPEAKVLGGSSLLRPETKSSMDQAIQGVFSSDLGIGPLKSRYYPTGKTRESGEKELILCNMLVERKLFLSAGGFKSGLYPNEENEFLNRISSRSTAIYCPGAVVYRNHRKTIAALAGQMFQYGRGRVKHFRISPSVGQLVFFLPLIFMVYFIGLFFSLFSLFYQYQLRDHFWIPALVYLILISFEGFIRSVYHRKWQILPLSIVCFFVCHFFYALGLALGIWNSTRKVPSQVKLTEIKVT